MKIVRNKAILRDIIPLRRNHPAGRFRRHAHLGARLQFGEDYLAKLYKFDLIFRTPGLSPNTPALLEAVEKGSEVTSEMELFFKLCPCKILAVTGSDGKTTTTPWRSTPRPS